MRLITDYLDRAADTFSNKIAVADSDKTLTYIELCDASRRIASSIISMGLFKQPVALIMNEGVDMMTAFFGVAYSGNFYAAINPKQPKEKIVDSIRYLKAALVITTREWSQLARECVDKEVTILDFEEMPETEVDIKGIKNVQANLIDADPLYLVFTSGSTGKPKGVIVTHQNVVYIVKKGIKTVNIKRDTIMACHFSMYFVASILIYAVLINGGICLLDMGRHLLNPTAWNQMINEYRVNYIGGTPAFFELMSRTLSDDDRYESIRCIMLAGVSLTVKKLHQWDKFFPNASVYSCYGMSELGGRTFMSIFPSGWREKSGKKINMFPWDARRIMRMYLLWTKMGERRFAVV